MSLAIPSYSKYGLYIGAHMGDIDQDPERTEVWHSFLAEEDNHAAHNRSNQYSKNPSRVNSNVLNVVRDPTPPRSRMSSFVVDNPPLFRNFSTQDKMVQYQNGSYITNCLKGRQNMNKGANELNHEFLDILKADFRKGEDGAIEMVNKEFLKKQKTVASFIMKQFGSALFSGKSITTVSLPVYIFRPISALEQEARCYTNAPHFLEKAGLIKDTLEQFKLAISHYVSSLLVFVGAGKPFNPLHCETFQGIIGGCPIYVEQVSHHPPISAVQMIGKNFKAEATTEVTVNISMTLFKLCKVGHQKVFFKNTNTTVKAQLPPWVAHGGLGKKTFQFGNKLYVFDIGNKLYAEIVFDYEEPSIFKKTRMAQDHFSGSIWKINDKFVEYLRHLPKRQHELDEIKFKEKEHSAGHVARIEGNWLEYLKIGDKMYWTTAEYQPYKLQYFDNPLPSDSNFRLDVLYLREGNEGKAQELKDKIEEVQRHDKKLRDKYKKSHK